MSTGVARQSPWLRSQSAALIVADLLGLVLVTSSWYGASGSSRVETHIAWANLGVAGVALIAGASGIWLIAGRRVVATRCKAINQAARAPMQSFASAVGNGIGPQTGPEQFLASDAMRWYHRAGCLCVDGKSVNADRGRRAHEEAGRAPCRVCQP